MARLRRLLLLPEGLGASMCSWRFGGSDHVLGGEGNDRICGGDGNDFLHGGNANSSGGDGDDQIAGQVGNDYVAGEGGNDFLSGFLGDDTLIGDFDEPGVHGNDSMSGGTGNDYVDNNTSFTSIQANLQTGVVTGDGNDQLTSKEIINGSRFDDTLTGRSATFNYLMGNEGNDVVNGGGGRVDLLGGGGGDDTLNSQDGDTQDRVDGNDHVTGDTCTVDSGDIVGNCEL
jgi:Ca2+-binding RTX toxin-like protein